MATNTDNRRRSPRLPAHLVVTIQPLTSQRVPLGPLIDGVAVDLSQGGVCIVSDHPLLSDFALVEMQAASTDQTVRLLARRIRCRRKGPMFEIAMRFVEKIADDVDH
jgi:hypothetical protein